MTVLDILALRFLISAVAFIACAAAGVVRVSFRGKHILTLAALSLFDPIVGFTLETLGLSGVSTSLGGILIATAPVGVIILERIILKEHTTLLQKALLVLTVIGMLFASVFSASDSGENTWWGILCMLGATFTGCIFTACARKASREFSSVEITFFITMVGAVVFNAASVADHIRNGTLLEYFLPFSDWKNAACLIFLGVGSSIIAMVMSTYALARIQASYLSALGGVTTIVTIALGVVFNNETLSGYHILGAVLILVGAVGVNLAGS